MSYYNAWRGILILLLLWGGHNACAQYFVQGVVLDEEMRPIENVKVEASNSVNYTDEDGRYRIQLSEKKGSILFSHISYSLVDESYSLDAETKDTLQFDINMSLKSNFFDPINVFGEEIGSVYTKKDNSIIDFDFYDGKILMIVKEKRTYYLRLFNEASGKEEAEKILDFKPAFLKKDCLSNFHVISEDSAYQILDQRLFLYPAYGLNEFYELLGLCRASSESFLYLQSYTDFNQTVCYEQVNRITGERVPIRCITDEESVDRAIYYKNKTGGCTASELMGEVSPDRSTGIGRLRECLQNVFLFELTLTLEVYHPIIYARDSLYLFDHLKNRVFVMDEQGKNSRDFPIRYAEGKDWLKPLLFDPNQQQLYVVSSVSSNDFSITEISLNGGELGHPSLIQGNARSSQAMKIRNGWVYYLYRPSSTSGFWKLYKQRL